MSSTRIPNDIFQISEKASFSVSNGNNNKKKIRFYYDAPAPQDASDLSQSEKLMLVVFPPVGNFPPNHELELTYSNEDKMWIVDFDAPMNLRDRFIVTRGVDKNNPLEERQKAEILEQSYFALTNGVPHPSIYSKANIPKGTLREILYKEDGSLEPLPPGYKISDGERIATLYLPANYDKPDQPPFNFQITLDGKQFLEAMHMNVAFDNLIASKQIEPTVVLFISPYCGKPDSNKPGFGSVCPPGFSLDQRFKEYSCNPQFAEQLAALTQQIQDKFNVTNDPDKTTIWGFSMGALQASYTALLYPNIFGNVVAQSMMAFNIPTQHGENWRNQITNDWQSATTILHPTKEEHNEYLTQMLLTGKDAISGKQLSPSYLNWYFTAGVDEERYDPKEGTANLVAAMDKFASALVEKGHSVAEHRVGQEARHVLVVSPGWHTPITCMESAPGAIKYMNPYVSQQDKLLSTAKIFASAAMSTSQLNQVTSTIVRADELKPHDANSASSLNANQATPASSLLQENTDPSQDSHYKTPTLKPPGTPR